jgi:hypothetical protein
MTGMIACVVTERRHRVITERPLERGLSLSAIRAADHDRDVEVDHHNVQVADGLRTDRPLNLRGSVLTDTTVKGTVRFVLSGTMVRNSAGPALAADGLQTGAA